MQLQIYEKINPCLAEKICFSTSICVLAESESIRIRFEKYDFSV